MYLNQAMEDPPGMVELLLREEINNG